jgi:hypothetical protein
MPDTANVLKGRWNGVNLLNIHGCNDRKVTIKCHIQPTNALHTLSALFAGLLRQCLSGRGQWHVNKNNSLRWTLLALGFSRRNFHCELLRRLLLLLLRLMLQLLLRLVRILMLLLLLKLQRLLLLLLPLVL